MLPPDTDAIAFADYAAYDAALMSFFMPLIATADFLHHFDFHFRHAAFRGCVPDYAIASLFASRRFFFHFAMLMFYFFLFFFADFAYVSADAAMPIRFAAVTLLFAAATPLFHFAMHCRCRYFNIFHIRVFAAIFFAVRYDFRHFSSYYVFAFSVSHAIRFHADAAAAMPPLDYCRQAATAVVAQYACKYAAHAITPVAAAVAIFISPCLMLICAPDADAAMRFRYGSVFHVFALLLCFIFATLLFATLPLIFRVNTTDTPRYFSPLYCCRRRYAMML